MSEERERFLQTLNATHQFPANYTFKLIGDNQAQLLNSALETTRQILPAAKPQVSRKESDKGNHQSITLIIPVPDAETVYALYARFRKIAGVRMLL
ncbi:MAG: DUF493 domain-containing protein [Myxococcales bacterium]|nr:DUF493 domain-containing protein [Myxococcales bacterium]